MKTHKAVIVNCENVLLLRDHVAEAAASGVLEGDARGLGAEDPVNVIAVVELIIEALRNANGLGRVTVLDDDEVVRLEEGPPHLKEVEVPDGGDDDVELILQERSGGYGSISHGRNEAIGRNRER